MYIYPSSPESASSLQPEESAAIIIQAGFRGYRVRKQLHRQSKSSNGYLTHPHPHPHHHHHPHRHSSSHTRRQQQRQQRSHIFMDNSQHNGAGNGDRPAPTLSAAVDGIGDGDGVTSVEDRCATKIQAGVRGFLVRKKQKIATDAAVKIQAGFRGFKARKEAQKLKQP